MGNPRSGRTGRLSVSCYRKLGDCGKVAVSYRPTHQLFLQFAGPPRVVCSREVMGLMEAVFWAKECAGGGDYVCEKRELAVERRIFGQYGFIFFANRGVVRSDRTKALSRVSHFVSIVFLQAASQAPALTIVESTHFGASGTCPAFVTSTNAPSWDSPSWSMLGLNKEFENSCHTESKRQRFEEGCPSKIGFLPVVLMALYIICYAPGMGTVSWIVNSEIYPLRYRGIAAMSNWTSHFIVSMSFLSIREAFGFFGAFLLFAGISFVGLVFIFFFVLETKGMRFEEIEKVLQTATDRSYSKENQIRMFLRFKIGRICWFESNCL
ncbi:inositol transporter 4 [Tripterygium wilfordii]|uniref:Inositol transporter 4 n=1 Tax=Tripterygium wilfordii TaxID=458696 RepID=A0A7J7C406_TRIWF|nr:inositol transporter 4 [Tripterygium wilfordii]